MDDLTIARVLHVLAVVLWIGGVGFVTTGLLPAVRQLKEPAEQAELFDAIERRFASQARITTAMVGLSGFYMLIRFNLWDRFRHLAYWWMHAMIAVWLIFTVMLFVIEPFILRGKRGGRASEKSEGTLKFQQWLHWVLFLLSLITIAGAVVGSHGLLFFE
jgi:uncharacterized membrane protein